MSAHHTRPVAPAAALLGRTVVITRPAGTGSSMARQVRALGGRALLLPGLSLRGMDDATTRAALADALRDDVLVFSSPAAVRFAARLQVLRTGATVLAVGQGTARALHRQGVRVVAAPSKRQDSEGLLDLPIWAALGPCRIALIGAPGGRGVLRDQLATRGSLREVQVYRRAPPRLRASHWGGLHALERDACVLLSSAEAMENLRELAPTAAWQQLTSITAVVSSERLSLAARTAGFSHIHVATSANAADMLAAAADVQEV
ncbi:uroporphyrinogen-III synthase [Dyella sp. GSA-30]|uniref:uroporphyrinogen-III synthase n=1 Tax=Dyella sp. GSA-30 TaxID=2994496 RepID=UPI002490D284|nr:uroporphyrinogen-III synthase [Dyella sp. GSA-30]BDU19846.1 uroporphyrinogen III methyltransferase [Dyella sp. GSA-30]